jgi:hypothetical protein
MMRLLTVVWIRAGDGCAEDPPLLETFSPETFEKVIKSRGKNAKKLIENRSLAIPGENLRY